MPRRCGDCEDEEGCEEKEGLHELKVRRVYEGIVADL